MDGSTAGFEAYGSFAGPPSQPNISDVGATSLLLTWEAPQHLGGSHFEVIGHQITMRIGGDGEFAVHTADTGCDETQHVVEELAADTWHEFVVHAITAAGIGAASQPSHPVLMEPAPKLLRNLRAATKQLAGTRSRLARKRAELLQLAQSGTMALDAASMSATAAKKSVQARRALERTIEGLERKEVEQEHTRARLAEQQASVDEERHAELEEAAAQLRGGGDDSAAEEEALWRATLMGASGGTPAAADGGFLFTPAKACAAAAAAQSGSPSFSRSGGVPRRSAAQERKRLQMLSVYSRLFLEEDSAQQATYPPFVREETRAQLRRALSLHVLSTGDDNSEKAHYFDLALNRARSATTHNVFPRFADWELEQLVLLFGRLDVDHDGVLEFADFCRLMLLVGERVNAPYTEAQLLRMFRKADLNDDHLIDLNEFLWLQTPANGGSWAGSNDGGDGDPQRQVVGVHPRPAAAY